MTIVLKRKSNKEALLTAVQDHIKDLVNGDFDGNVIIPLRKGYLGKIRSTPRKTTAVFDPREEIGKRRVLLEA